MVALSCRLARQHSLPSALPGAFAGLYRPHHQFVARRPPQRIVCVFFISHSVTHIRTGAEATLTRFWKTVHLQERGDALSITLDSRSLKTPAGKPLLLPRSKRLAATLIVTEWENQRDVLKSHALPMVCDLCLHHVKGFMSVNQMRE